LSEPVPAASMLGLGNCYWVGVEEGWDNYSILGHTTTASEI